MLTVPKLRLSCRIRQSVETASAAAAKEVARADALARAARKAKNVRPGLRELERLKVLSWPLHLAPQMHFRGFKQATLHAVWVGHLALSLGPQRACCSSQITIQPEWHCLFIFSWNVTL